MGWLEYHRQSEQLASNAEVTAHRGDSARARELYIEAAQAEEKALQEVELAKSRTYGITAVSAVSLYFKATEWKVARNLAHRCLGSERLPGFAYQQMDDLLDSIKAEDAAHSVVLIPSTREEINGVIKENRPPLPDGEETEIRGVLRALHLDDDWIEVIDGISKWRVENVREEVDDRIGPMVNHPVVVQAVQTGNRIHFIDIDADE